LTKKIVRHTILDRFAWIFLLILLIGIGSVVFWQYLTFEYLYLFSDIGSDTLNSRYPNMLHKEHYQKTEGLPFKWSFYVGMGQNMFGGFKFHFMDIANQILGFLSLEKRIIYLELFKIIACGGLFYAYLSCLKLKGITKIISSLCYAFSGYMVLGSTWYVHSRLLLDFTFLLLCCEYLIQDKRGKWLLPLAVYFIGFNPQLYYFGIFIAIYGWGRIWEGRAFSLKKQWIFTGKLIGLGLLGLVLLIPEISSQFNRYMDSPRMSGAASSFGDLATTPLFSLESPMHYFTVFLRLFNNDLLGTGDAYKGWVNYLEAPTFYIGLVMLVLLPLSFFLLRRVQKIFYFAMLGFWTALVIFPFGRYAFYAFAGDYYKSAFSIFIPFSILFVASQVLDKLIRYRRLPLGLLWGSVAMWCGGLGIAYALGAKFIDANLLLITMGILVVYGVVLSFLKSKKYSPFAQVLLLCLVVGELTFFAQRTLSPRQSIRADRFEKRLGYNDYTVEALEYLKEKDKSFYRIEKYYSSSLAGHKSLNDAKVQKFYGTANYASFNQGHYIRFLQALEVIGLREIDTRWVVGLRQRPLLQTLCAVKYQLHRSNQKGAKDDNFGRSVKRFGDVTLKKNRYVLPLGFGYDQYMKRSDFDVLESSLKDRTLLKACVIENDEVQGYQTVLSRVKMMDNLPSLNKETWAQMYGQKDTLVIQEHSQNSITGAIELERPQLLFFSIPYDKHWKVFVDGMEEPLEVVNIGFMGVLLDAGSHEVRLEFDVGLF